MSFVIGLIILIYIIYFVARVSEHYNPNPGGSMLDSKRTVCGQMFGQELLLADMEPGTGLRKCCLLFENHEGDHATENPDLDLDYQEGDLT